MSTAQRKWTQLRIRTTYLEKLKKLAEKDRRKAAPFAEILIDEEEERRLRRPGKGGLSNKVAQGGNRDASKIGRNTK